MKRARILVASLAVLASACGGTPSTTPTSSGTSRGTSASGTGGASGSNTAGSSSASSTTSSTSSTTTGTSTTAGSTTTGTSTTAGSTTTGTSTTTGSTTTGTSTTTGSTSTTGTTGSCPGYALPGDPASCPCGRPGSCAANNCYGGYYCRLSDLKCVAPVACTTSSSTSTSSTSGGTTATSTTTGTTGTSGTTGTTTGTTGSTGTPPYRVLFDSAHKQAVSNACWIIDSTSSADPVPASPTSATDWQGAISSWGFDLFSSGRYTIKQLPVGASLTYGGGGSGDLSNFDVFISDEPELTFSSTEQAAMVTFVNAGKGVMLISDHAGANRCSSCTQAATVINDFLVSGAGTSFGAKTDLNDIGTSGLIGNIVTSASLAQTFGNGPFGAGSTFSYHSGTSVSVTNSSVAQVVVDSSSGGMIVASTPSAAGRFVLIGDSSPEEDGSAAACPSANVHNGWAEANDRAIVLNATAWLAHDGS
jgi:hypothetical protein